MKKILLQIKNISMSPTASWDDIKTQVLTERELLSNYLVFIAAIPAISGLLGLIFMGENFFRAVFWAVLFFGFALLGVYLTAKAMNFLATSFNAEQNTQTYFKLTAFSATPIFLSGIFFLIPPIYGLSLLGLYGFYLFWIGFHRIVICPREEQFNFFFISLIAYFLIILLIFLLPALISGTAVYQGIL